MSQSVLSNVPDPSIPYATPSRRPGSPVLAGAAILAGGLGLVALGGCFLIGVLMITAQAGATTALGTAAGLNGSQLVLLCVLYVAAFACFAGALVMLLIGTRALLRVLHT